MRRVVKLIFNAKDLNESSRRREFNPSSLPEFSMLTVDSPSVLYEATRIEYQTPEGNTWVLKDRYGSDTGKQFSGIDTK